MREGDPAVLHVAPTAPELQALRPEESVKVGHGGAVPGTGGGGGKFGCYEVDCFNLIYYRA